MIRIFEFAKAGPGGKQYTARLHVAGNRYAVRVWVEDDGPEDVPLSALRHTIERALLRVDQLLELQAEVGCAVLAFPTPHNAKEIIDPPGGTP